LLGGSTTFTIDPRPPRQDEQSAPPAPAQPPLRCRAIGPPSPAHREKGLGGEGRTLPTSADRIAATRQEGRRLLAALAAAPPSPAAVELSAVVLGNLALVTIPGELPAALGADLAARSPAPTTLVLGYANGHAGYLVAASAVDSYEALASPFGPDAGPAVVTAALAHLHGLWSDAPGAPR
jgi:hypothetical protein